VLQLIPGPKRGCHLGSTRSRARTKKEHRNQDQEFPMATDEMGTKTKTKSRGRTRTRTRMPGCSLAKVNAKATNCVCTRAVEAGEDWQDWEDLEGFGWELDGSWMGSGWRSGSSGGTGRTVSSFAD